jgi:zinc D-Ala-D-Ala carboxypeptidase
VRTYRNELRNYHKEKYMNISDNISFSEATKSQIATRKGIDNTPNDEALENMRLVANMCFQPLREHFNKALGISSFYRSKELNRAIGGSQTSDHCRGCAIDIDADIYNNGISNADIFNWLKDNVDFDQLIWEYGSDKEPNWVHVSYRKEGNRNQILKATKKGYVNM